jgi:hypothetical protein
MLRNQLMLVSSGNGSTGVFMAVSGNKKVKLQQSRSTSPKLQCHQSSVEYSAANMGLNWLGGFKNLIGGLEHLD